MRGNKMKGSVRGWVAGLLLFAAFPVVPCPAQGQAGQQRGTEPAGSSLEFIDLEGGEGVLPGSQEEQVPSPVPKPATPEQQPERAKEELLEQGKTQDVTAEPAKETGPAGARPEAGQAKESVPALEDQAGVPAAGKPAVGAAGKDSGPVREVDSKKLLQSDSPEQYLEHREEIDKDLIRIYRQYYRKP